MTTTQQTDYAGASERAIKHHYDVGNDFWQLWLDPSMAYSCAMPQDGDDLETAQRRKLDWIIDAAGGAGVDRLLDVGCGWGALLRRALERDTRHGVGLTLSDAQRDWIGGFQDDRLEIHVQSWSDYDTAEPFDAIASVGAFEHFAKLGLSREGKVESYRDFFERCHRWLKPGGRLALQTIAKGDVSLDAQGLSDFSFIVKKIFPESDLPHPADIVEAIEGTFEPVVMRNDREMYVWTCERWLERLEAHRDEALRVAGEDLYKTYKRYLEACIRQFDRGHAVLLRFELRRIEKGRPFEFFGGAAA